MATIRNSLSLTDRMTPTLRSILRAMDSTLVVMRQLDKAANNGTQSKAYKQAEKDIKRANNALIKMGNYTKTANSAAEHGAKAYAGMGTAAGFAAAAFDRIGSSATYFLQSLASGVYLAQKLADKVESIMLTGDTSRSQVARLGLYNASDSSNEQLYGQVFATAMGTRSGLDSTADLVNRLLVSGVFAKETATSSAIGTAGLINKALIAGGGTSEENERALTQLTQGLSSGTLQGDELRTIREQTPYLAQMLAEGLGKVDKRFEGIGIGDLKELGAQGQLTSEVVINAFWAMQDEIDKNFEEMPKTFGQAMTSLSNLWQYFLWLLSGADGPLGKINERLWQFVDYLQSPQGLELLNTVAVGINIVTSVLSEALRAAGQFVSFLQANAPVAQALFIALGAAALAAGISAAASWIAACWPILLVAAVVGLVAYAFLQAGYSAEQVVGAIVGGLLWLVGLIWDIVLIIIMAAWYIVMGVVLALEFILWVITLVLQGIVQLVMWIALVIWTAIRAVGTVIATIFMTLWGIIQWVLGGIENGVYTAFSGVLNMLQTVAAAIDKVFGTDYANTIGGWISGLDGLHATISGYLDADKTFASIEDMWAQFGDDTVYAFTDPESEWNIYENIGANWDQGLDVMDGTWDLMNDGGDLINSLGVNPNDWFDTGYDWGSGLVTEIGDLGLSIPDGTSMEVDGGYLDGIKSDVNIGEEDVQLLRDMAAREFLLNLKTVTPTMTVTFGDVRETADIEVIMDKLEQMVEEQLATSLVD